MLRDRPGSFLSFRLQNGKWRAIEEVFPGFECLDIDKDFALAGGPVKINFKGLLYKGWKAETEDL